MNLQADTSGYKQASRAEYRGYKQDTNRGEYNGIWNNLAQEIIERIYIHGCATEGRYIYGVIEL